MRALLLDVLSLVPSAFKSRGALVLENLALRHQLLMLERRGTRPSVLDRDRWLWIALFRFWKHWRSALIVLQPETIVRWHRRGFRAYWAFKSRPRGGRPRVDPEVRRLIRHMWSANPTWGKRRVQAELAKLGISVSDSTVRRYRPSRPRPPSASWRAFLDNHLWDLVALDFFVVPSIDFRVLYVLVILAHHRRRILHVNVTAHPTAAWTAQQLREAFTERDAPRYLLHDRDAIFGQEFRSTVEALGAKDVLTAPASPWQNAYCERVIGSLRRECVDHVIVLGERHLLRVVREYASYYNLARPHRALDDDAPLGRPVELPGSGDVIVAEPRVGGLHHRYRRVGELASPTPKGQARRY